MRRNVILAIAVLALDASEQKLNAQGPVHPWEVYVACHYSTWGTDVPKLRNFCATTRLPVSGGNWTGESWSAWTDPAEIPTWQEIRNAVDSATSRTVGSLAAAGQNLPIAEIHFDVPGDTVLGGSAIEPLRRMAEEIRTALQQDSTRVFTVWGIADSQTRTIEANIRVAAARARALKRALVASGIPSTALEERPRIILDRVGAEFRAASTTPQTGAGPNFAAAGALAAAPATPVSYSGTSAILVGITDALVEQAQAEVQALVLSRTIGQLCSDARFQLPSTCGLFSPVEGSYTPTLGSLRSAIRSDLSRVPLDLARGYFLSLIPDTLPLPPAGQVAPTPEQIAAFRKEEWVRRVPQARTAVAALYFIDALSAYQEGRDPLGVWGTDPQWLERLNLIKDDPILGRLREVTRFASAVDSTRSQILAYVPPEALHPDTIVLYALRTQAVNAARDGTLPYGPKRFTELAQLAELRRSVGESLRAVDSVRVVLREVRSGTSEVPDSIRRAQVRALTHDLIDRMSRVPAMVLTHVAADSLALDIWSSEWRRVQVAIVPAIAGIVSAATVGDYRSALQATIQTIAARTQYQAAPNALFCLRDRWFGEHMEKSASCTAVDLSTTSVSPRHLALITFAVDLAEAEDETSVKRAMQSYLRQQRGRAEKRGGGGPRSVYWSINAYVGGQQGGEQLAPGDAVTSEGNILGPYIPLGGEAGVRLGSNWTLGALVQLVDLGAIATYRTDHPDSVELNSGPRVEQIISAGVGLVMGLGRIGPIGLPFALGRVGAFELPLSVGHTWTYLPAATQWEGVGGVDARRGTWFVAVDIPLFQ